MGMLDSQLILAEGQAVTAIGDTGSTANYDAGSAALGPAGLTGENLWVQAFCSGTVTSGGAPTVQAVLQDSSDGATWNDVVSGPPLPLASLVKGAQLLKVQPPPGMLEFWRIAWRVATAALTGGTFDGYISNTLQDNVPRPSGFSVA